MFTYLINHQPTGNIMNALEETKSAAARFMDEHDRIATELTTARLTIEDQRKEIEKQDALIATQKEALAQANTDKNTYLQYAFELAAQLQFIVSGSARALKIAHSVRSRIAAQANGVSDVPGADVAELEELVGRMADKSDGVMVDQAGHPVVASVATRSMQMAS